MVTGGSFQRTDSTHNGNIVSQQRSRAFEPQAVSLIKLNRLEFIKNEFSRLNVCATLPSDDGKPCLKLKAFTIKQGCSTEQHSVTALKKSFESETE